MQHAMHKAYSASRMLQALARDRIAAHTTTLSPAAAAGQRKNHGPPPKRASSHKRAALTIMLLTMQAVQIPIPPPLRDMLPLADVAY